MGLWSKKKEAPVDVSPLIELPDYSAFLTFNKEDLQRKVQEQWNFLYDLRNEMGWKILMAQIERIKNLYVLDTNLLKKRDNFEIEFARHQGRIEALTQLESMVQIEMKRIKQAEETKGKEKNGEKSMIKDTRRSARQKAGPSLAV